MLINKQSKTYEMFQDTIKSWGETFPKQYYHSILAEYTELGKPEKAKTRTAWDLIWLSCVRFTTSRKYQDGAFNMIKRYFSDCETQEIIYSLDMIEILTPESANGGHIETVLQRICKDLGIFD